MTPPATVWPRFSVGPTPREQQYDCTAPASSARAPASQHPCHNRLHRQHHLRPPLVRSLYKTKPWLSSSAKFCPAADERYWALVGTLIVLFFTNRVYQWKVTNSDPVVDDRKHDRILLQEEANTLAKKLAEMQAEMDRLRAEAAEAAEAARRAAATEKERVEAAAARRLAKATEAAEARTKAAGEESLRRQAEEGANQKSMADALCDATLPLRSTCLPTARFGVVTSVTDAATPPDVAQSLSAVGYHIPLSKKPKSRPEAQPRLTDATPTTSVPTEVTAADTATFASMGLSLAPIPKGYFTTLTGSRPMYKIYCSSLPPFWRNADLAAFAALDAFHLADSTQADRAANIGRVTIDTFKEHGADVSRGWGWISTSSADTALALLRADNNFSVRDHNRASGDPANLRFKISHAAAPGDTAKSARASGKCFKCLKPGHSSRECPNGRTCQRCGSTDHIRRHCPVTPPVCHRCGDPGHATDKCHWTDEHVITDCANREGGAGRCPAFVPLPQIGLGPPPVGNHRAQANRAQYEAGWLPCPPQPTAAVATSLGPALASPPMAPPANAGQALLQSAPSSVAVVTCPANASPESRALYTVLSQTQQAQNN